MATLIPALGSCAARMTSGERRLAEVLQIARQEGYRLGRLGRRLETVHLCTNALAQRKILHWVRKEGDENRPAQKPSRP